MKILRIQHNVETRIYHTFVALGVGVDYINFDDYRGLAGQDIAQLFFTEQVWADVPLYALSRRNSKACNPPSPFGFRFAHPILIRKGLKAVFYTNQNVAKDDIHLLFYGYYTPNEAEIQKRPVKMIYLRGFAYDHEQTTMSLPVPHAYDLLSYGFLYAQGAELSEYKNIPETIQGWMEVLGKKYLFDEQQSHPLRLYSDFEDGIRMLVNNFNVKRFRIDANEVLKLALNSALGEDENLYTILEYEKLPDVGMYDHEGGRILQPYTDEPPQPVKNPMIQPYKIPTPRPKPGKPFTQRQDGLQEPGVVTDYPFEPEG